MTPSISITVHGLAACVSPLSRHQGQSSTPRCDPLPPALTRVLAAKFDIGVADVGDPLAVVLVAGVHAVCVTVTAPAHGDAQPIQPALELVRVAAPRRACGCGEGTAHCLHPTGLGGSRIEQGAGTQPAGKQLEASRGTGQGSEH